ncbi:hypothetical protein GCM10009657_20620 [Oryzihumus leptocrescens]
METAPVGISRACCAVHVQLGRALYLQALVVGAAPARDEVVAGARRHRRPRHLVEQAGGQRSEATVGAAKTAVAVRLGAHRRIQEVRRCLATAQSEASRDQQENQHGQPDQNPHQRAPPPDWFFIRLTTEYASA